MNKERLELEEKLNSIPPDINDLKLKVKKANLSKVRDDFLKKIDDLDKVKIDSSSLENKLDELTSLMKQVIKFNSDRDTYMAKELLELKKHLMKDVEIEVTRDEAGKITGAKRK